MLALLPVSSVAGRRWSCCPRVARRMNMPCPDHSTLKLSDRSARVSEETPLIGWFVPQLPFPLSPSLPSYCSCTPSASVPRCISSYPQVPARHISSYRFAAGLRHPPAQRRHRLRHPACRTGLSYYSGRSLFTTACACQNAFTPFPFLAPFLHPLAAHLALARRRSRRPLPPSRCWHRQHAAQAREST